MKPLDGIPPPQGDSCSVEKQSCLVQTEVSVDVSREPTLWAMAFPSERRMKMESSARPPRVSMTNHQLAVRMRIMRIIVYIYLTLARACAAKGYCSRSVYLSVTVGLSVGRSVCVSVPTFSLEPWLVKIPNVDMWVCATGARHSKNLERRCPRTACLRRGPKIICSYLY